MVFVAEWKMLLATDPGHVNEITKEVRVINLRNIHGRMEIRALCPDSRSVAQL